MTLLTTTIEALVEKLTPDVVGGYQAAEDKEKYVGNFCQSEYHSQSKGLHVLVDRLMNNVERALPVHGLIIPISDQ